MKFKNENGFSLIEVLVLIVVIGIVASTAMQWMTSSIDDIRKVKTEREMEMLAKAITGDPVSISGGQRSDFGYIGDIGAFPSNLQALYQNPGGFATWKGPYLPPTFVQDSAGFKYDEWGTQYAYTGGVTIASSGSGSAITKKIADAPNDYLLNQFNGTIKDSAGNVPGTVYLDSIDVIIGFPNGLGSTISKTYNPDSAGIFTLDSIPVGQHPLKIIYSPNVDTIFRYVTILPRHQSSKNYQFASTYFSGGGGAPISGSEILRPDGIGSATNLNNSGCTNWQCVEEIIADDDASYVEGFGANWNYDLYAVEDHTIGSGNIDSVIVYVRSQGNGGGRKTRTLINTNSAVYEGNQNNTTIDYLDYATTYISNPATLITWTWTEIDALEIGVDLKKTARCTQVWAEIFYTN